MSLASTLEVAGAYLTGQLSADGLNSQFRLGHREQSAWQLYRRLVRQEFRRTADALFPVCRSFVADTLGIHTWNRLIDYYFVTRPPRSFLRLETVAGLPATLRKSLRDGGAPEWLAEALDAEYCLRRTHLRPDEPGEADPNRGAPRVNPTLVIRRYEFEVGCWLGERMRRTQAPHLVPQRADARLAFWRVSGTRAHFARLGDAQLSALRRFEPARCDRNVMTSLHAQGIVLGEAPA